MSLSVLTPVLIAAFSHASSNLPAKRAGRGVTFLWMAAVAGVAIFLPLCFLFGVFGQVAWDLPTAVLLVGSALLQMLYFITLQRGDQVGDLSLVYPLARGAGPFFATLAAVAFLGERPSPLAFAGACMIVGGVLAMTFTAPGSAAVRRLALDWPPVSALPAIRCGIRSQSACC